MIRHPMTLLRLLAAVLFLTQGAIPSHARDRPSMDLFYDNLDPYGDWREVGSYGYCWQPRNVDPDWRPYSDGRWVHTDAGWTWDSDEPYGWAVYHYGRWANVGDIGWVWVPGNVWGPGWVSWRHSPKYVGWAPLPPEARFDRTMGLSAWVDGYYDIGPMNYRFVESIHFGSLQLRSAFIDRRENMNLIRQTNNVTNITYLNNTVHNGGPSYDMLSRTSRRPIGRYKLDRREHFDGDFRSARREDLRPRLDGDSLRMFAVPLGGHSGGRPKKIKHKIEGMELNRGWQQAGSAEQVEQLRDAMRRKAAPPDTLPRQPRYERTAEDDQYHLEPAKGKRKPDYDPNSKPGPKPKAKAKADPLRPTEGGSKEKKPRTKTTKTKGKAKGKNDLTPQ